MSEAGNNTRSGGITRNSVILIGRMCVITVLNLYAVRLILVGLGDIDYGIYNAVAGIVTMLSSLNTVLSLAIQRYYSMALGRNDSAGMTNVFSAALNINIGLVLLVAVLSETLGLWFVTEHLVFPSERLSAAIGCFHFSLISFLCTFLQVPFLAAVIAKEDMGIFAGISMAECLVRLLVSLSIPISHADGLLFYSGGLAVSSLLVMMSYVGACYHFYKECRYVAVRKFSLHKDLLSFSGWTMYGSLSNVGLIQGNTILLNIFFGPLLNAAFAISLQINNAFTSLCNTIILAFRPAMIKSYSEGNFEYVNRLFYSGNKLILYIMTCVAIPLLVEMETILRFWLGGFSTDMVLFARLIIVYVICMVMNNPITAIIQATGKVKTYHLSVDSVTLLCLPLTWGLFKMGFPAYSVFYSMIGLCVAAHIVRLFCLRRAYPFSILEYIKEIVLPFFPISMIVFLSVLLFYQLIGGDSIFSVLIVFAIAMFIGVLAVVVLGLNKSERHYLYYVIQSFKRRIR